MQIGNPYGILCSAVVLKILFIENRNVMNIFQLEMSHRSYTV